MMQGESILGLRGFPHCYYHAPSPMKLAFDARLIADMFVFRRKKMKRFTSMGYTRLASRSDWHPGATTAGSTLGTSTTLSAGHHGSDFGGYTDESSPGRSMRS
jgi:hypothetical protein